MSRIGSRLRDPEAGPRHFRGPRQVGDDSGDLGVARGRVPKVPEKAGRVSLDFIRTRPKLPPLGTPRQDLDVLGGRAGWD